MSTPQPYEISLYEGQNHILSLGKIKERWLMWHVTTGCNIECRYCYGTFDGNSYKKTYSPSDDVPIGRMLDIADEIAKLGFEHVNINGGETFLRHDIWQLIDRLFGHKIKIWALTNGTFLQDGFEENFITGKLATLAFSLDSIRPEYGNYVREKTESVLKNIKNISELKRKENVLTKLRLM